MTFDDISWFFMALSLLGNIFVIRKHVAGQWLWAIANTGWISFHLYKETYSAAFLFTVYFGMCVWGIYQWSKPQEELA